MNNFIKIEYLFWKLKLTLERFILIVHKEDAIFAMNFGKMQCALWTYTEDAIFTLNFMKVQCLLWLSGRCNVHLRFKCQRLFSHIGIAQKISIVLSFGRLLKFVFKFICNLQPFLIRKCLNFSWSLSKYFKFLTKFNFLLNVVQKIRSVLFYKIKLFNGGFLKNKVYSYPLNAPF